MIERVFLNLERSVQSGRGLRIERFFMQSQNRKLYLGPNNRADNRNMLIQSKMEALFIRLGCPSPLLVLREALAPDRIQGPTIE